VSTGSTSKRPPRLVDAGEGCEHPFFALVRHRDKVGAMASQNGDHSWPLGIVRLVVYAVIAVAVGYAMSISGPRTTGRTSG